VNHDEMHETVFTFTPQSHLADLVFSDRCPSNFLIINELNCARPLPPQIGSRQGPNPSLPGPPEVCVSDLDTRVRVTAVTWVPKWRF
jgi:hypothetical protein